MESETGQAPSIFIISGVVGSSGEYLVKNILAQYPGNHFKVGSDKKIEMDADEIRRQVPSRR